MIRHYELGTMVSRSDTGCYTIPGDCIEEWNAVVAAMADDGYIETHRAELTGWGVWTHVVEWTREGEPTRWYFRAQVRSENLCGVCSLSEWTLADADTTIMHHTDDAESIDRGLCRTCAAA